MDIVDNLIKNIETKESELEKRVLIEVAKCIFDNALYDEDGECLDCEVATTLSKVFKTEKSFLGEIDKLLADI